MGRRILTWTVAAVVFIAVLAQPHAFGRLIHEVGDGLSGAGHALGTVVNSATK